MQRGTSLFHLCLFTSLKSAGYDYWFVFMKKFAGEFVMHVDRPGRTTHTRTTRRARTGTFAVMYTGVQLSTVAFTHDAGSFVPKYTPGVTLVVVPS